jgi:hypothetical protein
LWQEQLDGKITDLEFQTIYWLSESPKVTIRFDFRYKRDGQEIIEDSKGIATREWLTKQKWFEQKYNKKVFLSKPRRYVDPEIVKRQVIKKQSKQQELADTDAYLHSVIK